ncbi:XisI protein [Haliscomenobacter hydrossis]|uniref:XisI protein n=1 Tax=Haliscomenobacter hydrossis (strain ATCC 27775 / DSM 1100 / LMG 10767 / O) TaxID=760192 RepID=F4L764_HALH1|nr:XisI protein [Haliscomenobacter hydrossis]AEE52140.1 XisI protein [Haliscomenobacter hydrossis DSM 1100]
MDKKIKKYQQVLEAFLQEEADSKTIPGIEFQVITDTRNNHFQLVETGWFEKQFIHSVIFHFQIKPDGKIWLLANNTDMLVAEELVKKGVPALDIVIGFHPESARQFTGFAVA